MKCFWLILAAAPAFGLVAQTNPPDFAPAAVTNTVIAAPSTNAPPRERPPIKIVSEHGVVDLNNRVVVYSGHVVITDPQMKLTCDRLTVTASTNHTQHIRPDSGVAEGNVRIVARDDKDRPINARSDKAIYSYAVVNSVTNETITLTGNVYVDSAMGKGTADPIVWDRINNTIHMENQDMQIQSPAKPDTNAPPVKAAEKSFP